MKSKKERRKKFKIEKSLDELWEERQKKKLKHCPCGHVNHGGDKKCTQHLSIYDFFDRYQRTHKI